VKYIANKWVILELLETKGRQISETQVVCVEVVGDQTDQVIRNGPSFEIIKM